MWFHNPWRTSDYIMIPVQDLTGLEPLTYETTTPFDCYTFIVTHADDKTILAQV